MTPIRTTTALTLALLMSAGVVSAQTVDSPTLAATTVNTTHTAITSINADIGDIAFNPHNIVIAPGTTVTWTNRSSASHMIIADNGSFTSGQIPPGGTFSRLFSSTGNYVYYDSVSGSPGGKGMFGIIVVLPEGVPVPVATCTNCITSTPAFPNTGAGGSALTTILTLVFSGLSVAVGVFVLRKKYV
jgi:plastocyanin